VSNPSTTTDITVWCPVPREQTTPIGQTFLSLAIGGYDRNSGLGASANLSCTLYSIVPDSGALQSIVSVSTTGGGAGSGFVRVGRNDFAVTPGVLYLQCNIPRIQTAGWKSHLLYYEVGYDHF
jgi:hypothetical protein